MREPMAGAVEGPWKAAPTNSSTASSLTWGGGAQKQEQGHNMAGSGGYRRKAGNA
jgi:hypothetical protein